ncbi:MAG: hypothetical protein AAGF74_17035 [Pseudomonadota bacterium]
MSTVQATLLYRLVPELDFDLLRASLRDLAGGHGLPVSGATQQRTDGLTLNALPFEITVSTGAYPLAAATFNGALSGAIDPAERGPLGEIIAHHGGFLKVIVRDTGEARVNGEQPSKGAAARRRAQILGQDVVRILCSMAQPLALHWHSANRLALPNGLMASRPGTLHLPLCLRPRATSSQIDDETAGNMAQAIEGTEAVLGKPVHVMSTRMTQSQIMALAEAFVERCLESDTRPRGGARFVDPSGHRVRVVNLAPGKESPAGLIALIEEEQPDKVAAGNLSLAQQPNPIGIEPPSPRVTPERTRAVGAATARARQAIRARLKSSEAGAPETLPDAVAAPKPEKARSQMPGAMDDMSVEERLRSAFRKR